MNGIRHIAEGKLQRKLVRDLAGSKWLFLAVAAVIFLGVALFGASFLGYRNLKTSYDYTYETLDFADFTVKVVEAPVDITDDLKSIPGMREVTGRINTDIPLTQPGDDHKRVLIRAISLPADDPPGVNKVKVEEGSYFEEGHSNVLLVEKSFAEHHGLHPGDQVYLTINEQDTSFNIVGIITSPEYIWPAKSRQEVLVSAETFGVVFIPADTMTGIIGRPIVNEFCFLINEGEKRDMVIAQVEETLNAYTILDVVTREDQPSNAALKMDLQEFGEMAEVFPLLFLIVGALATYILLTRIVQNQRSQIGLMRAVGYTRRQVLIHYLSFALVIGIVGAVAGTIAGYLLSEAVTSLYVGFLGLPYTSVEMGWIEWLAIEEGLAAGILPCVVAGIIPAYYASRLSPAEAMRTPSPAGGRKLLLERLFPFLNRLSSLWKIPLRNIFRSRRRSLYTVIGVAFGISLILVSAAFIDSIDNVLDLQFNRIQLSDAQITFARPQKESLVNEVEGWSEVSRAEPVLQVPVRLVHKDNVYTTLVVGLSTDSELYGLYSTGGGRVSVGDDGILLGEGLRDTLDIATDDVLTILSPQAIRHFKVAGFVKQPMGSFGYTTLSQVQELASDPEQEHPDNEFLISGILLSVDPDHADSMREKAYHIPGAPTVELTSEISGRVDTMMDLIRGMMWVMLGFGAALSLAIVFTTVTVSILERRREIATMRTLGEGKGRIAAMITIENIVLGLTGVIPGIPLGYYLAVFMMSLVQSDMMNFYLAIFPRTYLMTVGMVILIMLLSQLPGIRNVNRMDLARVIKEQAT